MKLRTRQEILEDRSLTPYQRGLIFEEMNKQELHNPPPPRQITEVEKSELRKLGEDITATASGLSVFDKELTEHKTALETARQLARNLESPASLPSDEMAIALVTARARVELLANFLSTSSQRRAEMLAVFKSRIQRLAARLCGLTDRTMARDFENPNLSYGHAASMVVPEVERVIRGEQDAFEKIDQSRSFLLIT